MTRTYRRAGGLAVLVTTAAIGLAACGGGPGSPQVASLGNSSGNGGRNSPATGSSAATRPKGSPTRLLDEWAACMRSHGDPNQADPTVTASKLIDISMPAAVPGGFNGTNQGGQGNSGPGQFCRAYLGAAQTALRAGQPPPKPPSTAEALKFSECMQANGIPDFPDPIPGQGISLNVGAGGDLNYNSPTFQKINNLCVQKTGVQGLPGGGTPPAGTIELEGQQLPGQGANG
jgi:hypothetical protein